MATKKTDEIPAVPSAPASSVAPIEPVPVVAPAPVSPATPAPQVYAPATAAPPVYAPSPYPVAPAQGLSITSMIVGIVGVLFSFAGLGLMPALAAVITGHIAQKQQPQSKPYWLTGIITGYVGLAITLIAGVFILIVFIIGALAARDASNF